MKELCRKFLEEKKAFEEKNGFPPMFEELSEELQAALKEKASPVILEMGMTGLETYLKAF